MFVLVLNINLFAPWILYVELLIEELLKPYTVNYVYFATLYYTVANLLNLIKTRFEKLIDSIDWNTNTKIEVT